MRKITFHYHSTVTADFLHDRFARMRWFLTKFQNNPRKYYRHIEFVVIDETLQNFYASYNCHFKVYTKEKPGNYGLLFRVLTDAQDWYISRIIPYVSPPISHPEITEILIIRYRNFERCVKYWEKYYWGPTSFCNWYYGRTVPEQNNKVFQLCWKPLKNENSAIFKIYVEE